MRPFRCFLAVAIASNLAIEIPVTARSRAANREQVRVGHVERAAPMLTGRSAHTATLLENGNVLITGGMRRNQEFYSSAELYDVSGRFRPAGNMTIARLEPAAVLLSSGKVLIAGGWVSRNCTDSAEIYDSATGKFTAIGRMTVPRGAPSVTLLPDGDVLIAGGAAADGPGGIASAELFHPATNTFERVASMHVERVYHTATLLRDGRVLIAGGRGSTVTAEAELYDPKTRQFIQTGSLRQSAIQTRGRFAS